MTSESTGVLSRVDPTPAGVTDDRRRQRAGRGRRRPGAVWVANSRDATVSRVDPATDRVTARSRSVTGRAASPPHPDGRSVWVSNELAGTLSQIDPAVDRVVKTVHRRRPAARGRPGRAARRYVAVQGSGSAHRGGTLTVAVANPAGVYNVGLPKSLDPASGYTVWELLTLTNDGLVGYGRSGGAEKLQGRARSRRDAADRQRRRPDVHLPAASGHPLLDRSAGATGGHPPRDRACAAHQRRRDARPRTSAASSARVGCVTTPKRCDLSKGIVPIPSSNTVTFHLTAPDPDFLYKLALPMADAVPAGTPLEARLPLPATGPYEIAGYDAKRGVIRLVRNPRFRLWSAAAQPDGFPDRIVERYGYTGQSAVHAVERGTADITADGPDQTWPPGTHVHRCGRGTRAVSTTPRQRHGRGLAEHEAAAVRRPPRPARAQLRRRPQPPDRARRRPRRRAGVGCQLLPPNTDGYRRYCPYTLRPQPRRNLQRPRPGQGTSTRGGIRHGGRTDHRLVLRHPHRPAERRYLVSVLRGLGYKATLRLLPTRVRPGARTDRPASAAEPRTTRRPTTSSRWRSRAGRTIPRSRRRTRTWPGSAIDASTPRSPVPALSRRATRPPRRDSGARSTTRSPTRRPGS